LQVAGAKSKRRDHASLPWCNDGSFCLQGLEALDHVIQLHEDLLSCNPLRETVTEAWLTYF